VAEKGLRGAIPARPGAVPGAARSQTGRDAFSRVLQTQDAGVMDDLETAVGQHGTDMPGRGSDLDTAGLPHLLGSQETEIADAASAEAALPDLHSVQDAPSGLASSVSSLSAKGVTALQGLSGGALPGLRSTVERLPGDGAVAAAIGPVPVGIMETLGSRMS
jgi:hypothetical protein